jgi:hypothetical protein
MEEYSIYPVSKDGPWVIRGNGFKSVPINDNFQANYWCGALNQAYKEGVKYTPPKDWDDI